MTPFMPSSMPEAPKGSVFREAPLVLKHYALQESGGFKTYNHYEPYEAQLFPSVTYIRGSTRP